MSAIFIGAHGGLSGADAPAVHAWCEAWGTARANSSVVCSPLAVYVYDTSQVSPWR